MRWPLSLETPGKWLLGSGRDSLEDTWAFFWYLGDQLTVFTPLVFSGKGGVMLVTPGIGLTSRRRPQLHPKDRADSR